MDKFINYLKKQGVQEVNRTSKYDFNVCFEVQAMGDYSYFKEAPNFTYTRVCLYFEYNVEAGKEYFMYLDRLEKKIRSYAKKYGYDVKSYCTSYGMVYFNIARIDDLEKAESYYHYKSNCIEEWENVYHRMCEAGRTENAEKAARILNRIYSLRYRQFLRAIGE